jgi:formate hydrogenlyase subunit 3/multisubunit Na+/H+ antiporter MnhD subunit
MSSAHLHILLNHFPVIGTALAAFVLFYGFFKRSDEIKKLSLILLVITSLVTIPVYLTGENAEGSVVSIEGVNEDFIEPHEDFAFKAFIASDIVGALALITLFIYRKPKHLPMGVAALFFVLMLALNGMMAWTAHLGGLINHTEIMGESPLKKPNP